MRSAVLYDSRRRQRKIAIYSRKTKPSEYENFHSFKITLLIYEYIL